MYIFVVICSICIQDSPLLRLTKSRLCVVHSKHTEFTVLHNISHTLQFDLNTILNLRSISAMVKVFVWQYSKDFATVYEVGNKCSVLTFCQKDSNVCSRRESSMGRNIWLNCFKLLIVRQVDKILHCRIALLRSSCKQDKFFNAEMLCGESEENDKLL
jgi:hypothetical protein